MIEKLKSTYGFTKTPFGRGLAPQLLHRHGTHAEAVARIDWCISEVLSRNVEHLDYDQGHRILRLDRKGGKRAKAPLTPPAIRALEAYIGGRAAGPLFITSSGRRLDRTAAYRIVRRLAHQAAITSAARISPHSLRHSFATAALDSGVPLRDVQDAMGHADPRTTRRYDRTRHSLDRHATYAVASFLSTDLADPH